MEIGSPETAAKGVLLRKGDGWRLHLWATDPHGDPTHFLGCRTFGVAMEQVTAFLALEPSGRVTSYQDGGVDGRSYSEIAASLDERLSGARPLGLLRSMSTPGLFASPPAVEHLRDALGAALDYLDQRRVPSNQLSESFTGVPPL